MLSETIIKELKRKAKWTEELKRRQEAATAIDFYNYRQKEYLSDDISSRYPNEQSDIQRYKFTAPLVASLVNQLAVCFKNAPDITIKDVSDSVNEKLMQVLDACNIYKTLKQIDKYTELTGKVAVIPRWNKNRKTVVLDICTPDKCYVMQDPTYPTEITEFGYTIGVTDNVNLAEPMNIYAVWTAENYKEAEINNAGQVMKVLRLEPNPYKRIPAAWFEINQALDSFWLDAGNPFVELNRRINLQLTNLDIAMDYQSFSTMVTSGMNETSVIPIGVTRRINVPIDQTTGEVIGDVKYITPAAQLETVWKIIQESIIWFAGIMGISVESISQGSNFSSGFQLKLSKMGVIDHNNDKQDLYRESVRDLVQLVMDTVSIYGDVKFPADANINIDFKDITVETDPLETEQIHAAKMANGTMDAVMALMEDNPDLTEEEAKAKIAEIQARKRELSAPKLPPVNMTGAATNE